MLVCMKLGGLCECDVVIWLTTNCVELAIRCSRLSHKQSYSTLSPVITGMGDCLQVGIPPQYITSQLGQLSLASLWDC